jgi:hypothetical protein
VELELREIRGLPQLFHGQCFVEMALDVIEHLAESSRVRLCLGFVHLRSSCHRANYAGWLGLNPDRNCSM